MFVAIFVLIWSQTAAGITYPDSSVIRMGVTPYYENTPKLQTADSYSIARVTAAERRDACNVVRNCTIYLIPPRGHALLVTALGVDNGNNIGSLAVHIDHRLIWLWDERHEFNQSKNFRWHSHVDGLVKIAVNVQNVTTVWRHFKVNIVLTAFQQLNKTNTRICDDGFHFNCGNGRCIRRAYECDGYDNCGNSGDETFCGLDAVSAAVLFTCLAMSLGFLGGVFFLESRPAVVMRLLNKKLEVDPVAAVF